VRRAAKGSEKDIYIYIYINYGLKVAIRAMTSLIAIEII
jgi:hypothetical protein